MVLRACALSLAALSHQANLRNSCSSSSGVMVPVVTRDSTSSNSGAGAFSRQKSSGSSLPLHQHRIGLLSEPRPQRLDAARQHGHVEARVAHDAVADPGAHARGAHDDEGLIADGLIDPGLDLIEAVAQLGVRDVE